MMGTKLRTFAPQINVSLEELVPQDHFYRDLDEKLDLSFVRSFVEQRYAGTGRPSIDPVVFFKLQLVMFFESIRSERQLLRQAADRLSVRWYLGYDLGESLPDHSSLTRIRTRYGVEVFRRFFDAIVDQCQQAGLVWGKELYADATKVEANAALSSMQPRFAVEAHLASLFSQEANENEEAEKEQSPSEMDSPPCLPLDEDLDPSPVRHLPSSLDGVLQEELTQANSHRHDWIERRGEPERDTTHGQYQRLADFWVSTTDPDATMMNKKGGGTQLGYQTHYVVDGGKARIILAALVTPSEVMENQPILDLLWRVRFRWKLWPRQFTGDTTYGTAEIITALEQQHILPFVPLPDLDQRTEFFGQRDFHYDAQRDLYICPNGAELHVLPSGCTDQFKQYRAKASICNTCPLKSRCTTSRTGRRISRPIAEEAFERVRAFHLTDAYKKAINKRKVWVEPLFAEAKDWHGMRRFRLRRLWRVNCEALMKATGQNLKRLLRRWGWGRRPWPQGNVNALSEPPSENHLQMSVLIRAQQARACEQDQLVKDIFEIFLVCQSYFLFFTLVERGISSQIGKVSSVWKFSVFSQLRIDLFFSFSPCLSINNRESREGGLVEKLFWRVFQQAVILYGTIGKNGRGREIVTRLLWPLLLSLLLDCFLSNFASYMVRNIKLNRKTPCLTSHHFSLIVPRSNTWPNWCSI